MERGKSAEETEALGIGDSRSPVENLTRQQKIALQHLINGASMADALRKAGYAESTAKKQPPRTVKSIRDAFCDEAQRQGLTVPAIVERLRTRMYSLTLKVINSQRGEVVLMEDGAVQLKAIEIAGDFLGLKAPQKHEHSGSILLPEAKRRFQSTANRLAGYLVDDGQGG